jgi:hypothetical protein
MPSQPPLSENGILRCSGWLFDPDFVALDPHCIGLRRLEGRQAQSGTGANVEASAMSRTLHLMAVNNFTLNEGAAIVGAHVLDGINFAIEVEQSDANPVDFNQFTAPHRHVGQFSDFHKMTHRVLLYQFSDSEKSEM